MPGAVSGAPGASYPQRTDLNAQPVRTATGQPYGVAGAQAASQRAVPLPAERELPTPLSAPTSRPNEPIQSGAPFGPGRMAPAIQAQVPAPVRPGSQEDSLLRLQEAYRLYPSDDLLDLISAEMMR